MLNPAMQLTRMKSKSHDLSQENAVVHNKKIHNKIHIVHQFRHPSSIASARPATWSSTRQFYFKGEFHCLLSYPRLPTKRSQVNMRRLRQRYKRVFLRFLYVCRSRQQYHPYPLSLSALLSRVTILVSTREMFIS
jgi:hypothetical protein